MSNKVDVIVPVYGGLLELQRCLESVLRYAQKTPFRLVVINDASPFPEIGQYLRYFSSQNPEVHLLDNPVNLGFVGTVNRGMSLSQDADVVLLNSDTEVANDWLDRLGACAYRDQRVGSVTPFSNNATICSFPVLCKDNPLPHHWHVPEIDRVIAAANPGAAVEIPTGVGFCQYIRRDCLDQIGLFDEAKFGRGYGEENDFCRRAAAAGWLNLLCCDVFVFHEGGVSFSSEQAERVAKAQVILDQLYPDYHQLVQSHIAEDPALVYRVAGLLQMYQSSPRKKVLFISHHLGGGTWKHVVELADYLSERMDALVIRPGKDGRVILWLGVSADAEKMEFKLPESYPDLLRLLKVVGIDRMHFHHTLGLDPQIWGLPHDLGVEFDLTLHDYYFFNANPSQTDAQGRYRKDFSQQQGTYPLPVSIEVWQQNQLPLLSGAQRVIAPSEYTARLFAEVFPSVASLVAYHPDSELGIFPPVLARQRRDSLRVLVHGAISLEKGADLLEAVADAAKAAGLALEFHLLGYAYRPLSRAVIEHGAYKDADVDLLLREIDPDLVWFPALWPETYSYTLSEAMRAGLPVLVPDIGAFPERVAGRPFSWVAAWHLPVDDWLQLFVRISEELRQLGAQGQMGEWPTQPQASARFYQKAYLRESATQSQLDSRQSLSHAWLQGLLRTRDVSGQSLTKHESWLLKLVDWRASGLGRVLSRVVPISWQRAVKRKLSRRPLHELMR